MKHGNIRDYEWAASVCRRRSQRALNCVAGWLWAAVPAAALWLLTLDWPEVAAVAAAAFVLCLLMVGANVWKHRRAMRELREVLS